MTSSALRKLLGPKKAAPQPVQWIKVNRTRAHPVLVIPECFVCGSADAEIVWFNCRIGGVRCLPCFDKKGEL
jgi:hypothetical protein